MLGFGPIADGPIAGSGAENVTQVTSTSVISATATSAGALVSGTGHRYWRLLATGAPTHPLGYIQLNEIELHENYGSTDVTGSGTAAASSTWEFYYVADTSLPAYAFDDNNTSYWLNNGGWSGEWISYDFGVGVAKNIVEVLFRTSDATRLPSQMKLQWSDNNSAWTDAFTINVATFTANTNYVASAYAGGTLSGAATATSALVSSATKVATLSGVAAATPALVSSATKVAALSGAATSSSALVGVSAGTAFGVLTSSATSAGALGGFYSVVTSRVLAGAAAGLGNLRISQIVDGALSDGATWTPSSGDLRGSIVRSGALGGAAAGTGALGGQFFQTGTLAGAAALSVSFAAALGPAPAVLSSTATAGSSLVSSGLSPTRISGSLQASAQLVSAQTRAADLSAAASGTWTLATTALEVRALAAAAQITPALSASSTAASPIVAAAQVTPTLAGGSIAAASLQATASASGTLSPNNIAAGDMVGQAQQTMLFYTVGVFAEPLSIAATSTGMLVGAATARGGADWGHARLVGAFTGERVGHFAPDERVMVADNATLEQRTITVEPRPNTVVV